MAGEMKLSELSGLKCVSTCHDNIPGNFRISRMFYSRATINFTKQLIYKQCKLCTFHKYFITRIPYRDSQLRKIHTCIKYYIVTSARLMSTSAASEALSHSLPSTTPHFPPSPHTRLATPPSGPCGHCRSTV